MSDFVTTITIPAPLRLIVQPPSEIRSVLQVAQGPAGPASGSNLPPFQFSTPSDTWIINHNLGRRPLVGVFSVGGVEMWAEVLHISLNQVQVFFDDPVAGFAVCS